MPTYDYKCPECAHTASAFQSIGEYSRNPQVPRCPSHLLAMERKLSVSPLMSGLANALAGDRHYDGMRAPDGTDISSRTKHKEYMKRTGLTTVDDFKGDWSKADKERTALRTGQFQDKELRGEIAQQVMTAVAAPD